jgi:hypothetical protein
MRDKMSLLKTCDEKRVIYKQQHYTMAVEMCKIWTAWNAEGNTCNLQYLMIQGSFLSNFQLTCNCLFFPQATTHSLCKVLTKIHKTANNVLQYTLLQGVIYLQHVKELHSTRVNVIRLTPMRQTLPFLVWFSLNSEMLNNIMCRLLVPNFRYPTTCEKCERNSLTPLGNVWLFTPPIFLWNSQSLGVILWTYTAPNYIEIGQNFESRGKI